MLPSASETVPTMHRLLLHLKDSYQVIMVVKGGVKRSPMHSTLSVWISYKKHVNVTDPLPVSPRL